MAKKNGNICETLNGNMMCQCKTPDCSDFPTINLTVVTSTLTGETFELSFESKYFMRRVTNYIYRLMVQGKTTNQLGGNTVQWIFGQGLFHKYYAIFDLSAMKIGYIEQK